ncbi:MAG: acetyl-CoA synthase subunit gamma [Candidatus Omnitrophica bacterium]|nr:acetyl-CoA synthase subunit gamma [Candidatus Omnitrophota bacterium]
MNQKYIIAKFKTVVGLVPQVRTKLTWRDVTGTFLARWTFFRDNYKVDPGLYALGQPNADSDVFVSANYKMSFDVLRSQLKQINAWILVLDTKGINVWCAAGKKTFGTAEIVSRIRICQLDKIVKHRKIIVPQLGATGVAAHRVRRDSGFTVIYGPIRAKDIPEFLNNSMQATALMRTVKFSFYDRMVLVPAELVIALRYLGFVFIAFFFFSGMSSNGFSKDLMLSSGKCALLNIGLGYIAGTVIGPLLLPWLPGKSFALKGVFAGLIAISIGLYFRFIPYPGLEAWAWGLIIVCLASFLTMNFTGSSTYTSLSGVKKEMKIAVPLQLAGIVIGCGIWIFVKFI